MEFTLLDYGAFVAYLVLVVGFAMYVSRKEESSEDYFLAGRKLTWWLIGISLIASNISTEHFVGMAGAGYETGLTVASYEWTAAVAMILVTIFLLPRFLRRGIYTIPEYLEARYSPAARGLMAFFMMVAYVLVIIAAVLYAGAVALDTVFGESIKEYLGVDRLAETGWQWVTSAPMQWIFGIDSLGENWVIICAVWLIGIIAGIYTVWGGLKAVVWADLFNGLGLILGGVLVTTLGFIAVGADTAAESDAVAQANTAIESGLGIQEGAVVEPGAAVEQGSVVKKGATVKPNATVRQGAIVEENAVVEADAVVEKGAVVKKGAVVGAGAVVEKGAIVQPGADVEAGGVVAAETGLAWHEELRLGVRAFFQRAGDKLSAVKPWDDPEVPWIAVFIGGLWIPQLFYWGLNQFITQRALGARSLAQGQRGVTFAASLKLVMPFIIIFPGIMAFELYAGEVSEKDRAYPHMMQAILLPGLRGVMFAALFGAVMSSLDSMLNSASTILTMDLYKRHLKKDASERRLITLGRLMTALFVVLACLWAPRLGWIAGGKGVFDYIQKTWGFITPGIVTVFVFGLFSRRTPAQAACGAMLLGIPLYAFFLWAMRDVAFLHHMAFTFIALTAYMIVVTALSPLREVREASEPEPADRETADEPPGLLRNCLIPFATVLIGAGLFAFPIFQLSWNLLYPYMARGSQWLPFVTTAVVLAVYVGAALFVMRLPAPGARLLAARPEEARRPPTAAAPGRVVKFAVIGLLGAVVLGLHAYIFAMEIVKDRYDPEATYWERSFRLPVPWARSAEDRQPEKPAQTTPAEQGPRAEEQGEQEAVSRRAGPTKPAARGPAGGRAGDEPPAEPARSVRGLDARPAAGPGVEVLTGPALISVGAALAFLAGLGLIWWRPPLVPSLIGLGALVGASGCGLGAYWLSRWWMPADLPLRIYVVTAEVAAGLFIALVIVIYRGFVPPKTEVSPTTKIDLTPSRFGAAWGVVVVVATVALYTLFF